MITVKDSIEVQQPPEKVFQWLVQRFESKENYRAWHPDHVDIRWIKGDFLQEGSIGYAEEYLHGQLHRFKFRVTRVVPDKEIGYGAIFPWSLFAPGNAFIIEPKGENGSVFTAVGRLRADALFKKIFRNRLKATERHMKEEGENLKRALEVGKS